MKKQSLNIAVVMQSPDIGGAELYMLSLISEFLKNGCKIFLASNKEKFLTKAKKLPIKTYEIPIVLDIMGNYRGLVKSLALLPFAVIFYLNLLFKFKKAKVDVVLMSGFTEKLLVSILSLFLRIPVVWFEYGRLATVFKRNFYLPKLVYRVLKHVPKTIIVPSQNTMSSLVTDAGVALEKLKLISCGTVISHDSKQTKRSLFPQWEDSIIIGSVSRLTWEKGQDYLIKAMPLILKQVPDVRLLIVGGGWDQGYFTKLIKDLKIEDKVKMTGFVKDTNPYYQSMDIFAFPTVWDLEGFGLVLIEAMSYKLPIVASNLGPVPEIVDQKKTGLLVPAKDEKALAQALIYLAKNPRQRAEFGKNGYIKAVNQYALDKVSRQVLQVLFEASLG